MKSKNQIVYKSYLVRIWGEEDHARRRIMITRIGEIGEKHYFHTLDDLIIFFLQEFKQSDSPQFGPD